MTGFVVIGLFFGQMLDRLMTGALVAGYSILMFIAALWLNRDYASFRNLAFEIKERAAATDELSWHGVIQSPDIVIQTAPYTVVAIIVAGYLASLIFFFRTKKLDPKDFR